MEKNEKYKNKERLNILNLSFKFNLDPKLEREAKLLNFLCHSDDLIEFELFYLSNNTFLYHNKIKDFSKTFEGLDLNDLINFIYVPNTNSLILLFRKGDLFIIPVIYLETDLFDEYWNKIIREINVNDSFDYSNETSANSSSFSYFTDFLICSSTNKSENQSSHKTINNFNKNNISKLSIRHKNIINSFLGKNTETKLHRNKSENSLQFSSSKEHSSNSHKNKKAEKKAEEEKPKNNLDNNVSLIYWEDDNSLLNNFADFAEHNNSMGALGLNAHENDRILIMNIDNNLLFLELNSLECTILKFNHDIEQLLYVDYYKEEKKTDITKIINQDSQVKDNQISLSYKKSLRNRYDFLVIETKCEFYSLVLSDSNDYVNIRGQMISQIKPKKLKLPIGAKVFVQNYNSERVLVSYFNNLLDVYSIFALDEPMLSYNLAQIYTDKSDDFDIIAIFFYEKLIMILTKEIVYYAQEAEDERENEAERESVYAIKVLNAGKYQNNQPNVFLDHSSTENQRDSLYEKTDAKEILNIVDKLTEDNNNKDQLYFELIYYLNKNKIEFNRKGNEVLEVSDIKNQPVWSNKDYQFLSKKAKFISEFILNTKSGNAEKRFVSSKDSNKANKPSHFNKFSSLNINKIEHVLPKNAFSNKRLNQYKLKNYKELKSKNQTIDKEQKEILHILTDNSLISIQIPNLDISKNEEKASKKASVQSPFANSIFNFDNFIANLNMDYKTMRKLELLNHYLNGKFYEFIDKWLQANKSNLKIDREKYLKIKLLWDFNIADEIGAHLNLNKYIQLFKGFKLNEDQENLVLSLLNKINETNILSLLKETIIDFLSEEIWHSVNFHEQKEKILMDKINSFRKTIELTNEYCLFNILDKNNQIEKIIFNSKLFIKVFKSFLFQSQMAHGNFICKNPNKVFINYVTHINNAIVFLENIKANPLIDAILNCYQQEDQKAVRQGAVLNAENKLNMLPQRDRSHITNNANDEKEDEAVNISRNTGDPGDLHNESSSLLNLDCSVSLRDNKSIINMFNVNPINNNIPSITQTKHNRKKAFEYLKYPSKLGFNQFDLNRMLNNRLKNQNKFIAKTSNRLGDKLDNESPNLISVEDLKPKDLFSIASGNSAFSNLNNFEFLNLNVNIDSNIFALNQDTIFNTINLFVLDFFILEDTVDNWLLLNKGSSTNADLRADFYKKLINLFLVKNSNSNSNCLGDSPKGSESALDAEANVIRKNDLASFSKLVLKNFLVYKLKASNNLEDLVDNLKLYCVDYILENHSVLDKVFDENLFFKLEIISKKTNNSIILIKKLIEIILFLVNVIEINDPALTMSENSPMNEQNQNNGLYLNREDIKEIKIDLHPMFDKYLNKNIAEKLNKEMKESQKTIENKLLFNDTNEAFVDKILLLLFIFDAKISKQIKLINDNLMKIKLQIVTKAYQIMFLYFFDALMILWKDSGLKTQSSELLSLLGKNKSTMQRSIRIFLRIFFNVVVNENKSAKEKEKRAIMSHLKNNFGDFIFYENFENKIMHMIRFLYDDFRVAEEKIRIEKKPETLLSLVKSLSKLIQPENSLDEVSTGKKNEHNTSFLDFNQRKLINLIKKNSNIN